MQLKIGKRNIIGKRDGGRGVDEELRRYAVKGRGIRK